MKIDRATVVTINYTLKLDSGQVVDSTDGRQPFSFLTGSGQIIPGLERQLMGLEQGDEREIRVNPEEGYGPVDPDAIQTVSVGLFPEDVEIEVGQRYTAKRPTGERLSFTIVEVNEGNATVDFNHPLAGENLNFHVMVRGVRQASKEEEEQGKAG